MSVSEKLTAIADAIRAKTGGTDSLTLDAMATAIASIATTTPICYLYNHGECSELLGGWTAYAYKDVGSGSTPRKPTITDDGTKIKFSLANSTNAYYAGCMMSDNAIDVTDYSALKLSVVNCGGAASPVIGVTDTKANNYSATVRNNISAAGETILDISEVTGLVYIFIRAQGVQETTSYVTFDAMRME